MNVQNFDCVADSVSSVWGFLRHFDIRIGLSNRNSMTAKPLIFCTQLALTLLQLFVG